MRAFGRTSNVQRVTHSDRQRLVRATKNLYQARGLTETEHGTPSVSFVSNRPIVRRSVRYQAMQFSVSRSFGVTFVCENNRFH